MNFCITDFALWKFSAAGEKRLFRCHYDPPTPLPRATPVVRSAELVIDSPPIEATKVEPALPAPPATDEPSEAVQPAVRHGVLAAFLEEKNILWGELVGGLLIVGCSIALVLTLWRDLQDLPYSSFLMAAGITAALFGAGQYTLHHWKLASTSRDPVGHSTSSHRSPGCRSTPAAPVGRKRQERTEFATARTTRSRWRRSTFPTRRTSRTFPPPS